MTWALKDIEPEKALREPFIKLPILKELLDIDIALIRATGFSKYLKKRILKSLLLVFIR